MNEISKVTEAAAKSVPKTPALPDAQTVTQVKHWTDRLFSFRVTRPASLRFRSGEFVMIGLMQTDPKTGKEKPLLRAYSIASPSWDDELEFYSIKVQDGPLTSRLLPPAPALRPSPRSCAIHKPTRITTRSLSPTPAARWASWNMARN
jgi:ferredoxin--NADP+ reductase